jgi:hypothetical protein
VHAQAAVVQKTAFCNFSVPNIAHAVYCSIWRTKCGLPPTIETKDEIVARLSVQQHTTLPNAGLPLLGKEDIDYLVQEAMKYHGDLNSFIKDASDHCKTAWDQNEEDRRKRNVTH